MRPPQMNCSRELEIRKGLARARYLDNLSPKYITVIMLQVVLKNEIFSGYILSVSYIILLTL